MRGALAAADRQRRCDEADGTTPISYVVELIRRLVA
jgi:hypothetical protein